MAGVITFLHSSRVGQGFCRPKSAGVTRAIEGSSGLKVDCIACVHGPTLPANGGKRLRACRERRLPARAQADIPPTTAKRGSRVRKQVLITRPFVSRLQAAPFHAKQIS